MTTVFYILVAFCLMFEVLNLLKVKKTAEAVKRYKGKKAEECSSTFIAWCVCNWIYLIICFVGLMSTQWIGFLALIILSFIPKRWMFLPRSKTLRQTLQSWKSKCVSGGGFIPYP